MPYPESHICVHHPSLYCLLRNSRNVCIASPSVQETTSMYGLVASDFIGVTHVFWGHSFRAVFHYALRDSTTHSGDTRYLLCGMGTNTPVNTSYVGLPSFSMLFISISRHHPHLASLHRSMPIHAASNKYPMLTGFLLGIPLLISPTSPYQHFQSRFAKEVL